MENEKKKNRRNEEIFTSGVSCNLCFNFSLFFWVMNMYLYNNKSRKAILYVLMLTRVKALNIENKVEIKLVWETKKGFVMENFPVFKSHFSPQSKSFFFKTGTKERNLNALSSGGKKDRFFSPFFFSRTRNFKVFLLTFFLRCHSKFFIYILQ